MTPRAIDDSATMPPPANHVDRRAQSSRGAPPPPNYGHQSYPPPASSRVPPSPHDYPYYEGYAYPPRWQREEVPPPYYAYDVPYQYREEPPPPSRPYLPPMNHPEQQDPRMAAPPPNSEEYAPRRETRGPPIQYRPSSEYAYSGKRTTRHPAQTQPPPEEEPESSPPAAAPTSPQKPGALSLLAKVASGNRDRPKQQQDEEEEQEKESSENNSNPEFVSPVRREPPSHPHSPHAPVIWTPNRAHPYSQQQQQQYRGPPPRRGGEWREGAYPPTPRQEYWTYEGPGTPPALGQPVSFDEGSYHHSPPQHLEEYQHPPPVPRGYPDHRQQQQYEYPPPPPPAEYHSHHRRGYSGQYISPSASREMEPEQPPAAETYHYPPRHQYPSQYSHVQQPRDANDKIVLRKKFSWKHYPELERFLISNRDDYLRHSALNYTAEQKQYNNTLTDRLLEVAEQYGYVFDPDDFNYVGIRDRIRCYYKSYVQTMRKRGRISKAKSEGARKQRAGVEATSLAERDAESSEDLPEYKEEPNEEAEDNVKVDE